MPAKKAAKKAAAKHVDPKHHERKNLRRAYEHLGRIEILQRTVKAESSKDVHTLVSLAEKELGNGNRKVATDLLRAAEHFSFAALAPTELKSSKVSPQLKDIVMEEVEHLTRKASKHWDNSEESEHHAAVRTILQSCLKGTQSALDVGSYRQALELSRGAEALAHVKKHGTEQLEVGKGRSKLQKL